MLLKMKEKLKIVSGYIQICIVWPDSCRSPPISHHHPVWEKSEPTQNNPKPGAERSCSHQRQSPEMSIWF